MRRSAEKCAGIRRRSRAIAARALREVFPGPSENAIAERAAAVLAVHRDTVARILREETDARLSVILPVLAMWAAVRGIEALEAAE